MNFGELKAEVQVALIDTPPAIQTLTGSLVNRAIKSIQRKHNFKDMERSATFVTVTGQRTLGARPTDWKGPRGKAYFIGELDGFGELDWVSQISDAQALYGDNPDFDYGHPSSLNEDVQNGQLLVFPYPDGLSTNPDGEYRVHVPYWAYLPALVNDGDTNWFTEEADEYVLFTAISQGFYLNEDDSRAQLWQARAVDKQKEAILANKNRYLDETDTLVPYLGAHMPHASKLWR